MLKELHRLEAFSISLQNKTFLSSTNDNQSSKGDLYIHDLLNVCLFYGGLNVLENNESSLFDAVGDELHINTIRTIEFIFEFTHNDTERLTSECIWFSFNVFRLESDGSIYNPNISNSNHKEEGIFHCIWFIQ